MITNLYEKKRVSNQNEADLITRIAWMYYHEGMTQQEIGVMIGLSRPKVQRMLEKAKDLEVVTFKIKHPNAHLLSIEHTLRQNLGLKDAIIVPSSSNDPNALRQSFARACSDFLERFIRREEDIVIGFGWGNTTSYLPDYFDPSDVNTRVTVVTLIGNLPINVAMNSYITAEVIARRLNAPFYNIWAPAIAKDKDRASIFKSEPQINETLDRAGNTDIAVFSLGEVSDSATLFEMGFLSQDDLSRLMSKGAVADIIGRFIDKDGNVLEDEIHDRVIGISLDALKNPDTLVVGVAGGESKFEGINAAVRGGFLDVLITDENNAKRLCE